MGHGDKWILLVAKKKKILEIQPTSPWKKSYDKPRQHIKKQRHYFANKGPSSESYGFSSSHIQLRELDHEKRLSIKELMPSNYGVGEHS